MANEYLFKKWKLWFQCIDRQHKGQVSKEDETREEEAFVRLSNLGGEQKKQFVEVSQKLWNQFIFHGKSGPVSEKEFIDMTNQDFGSDREKFEENIRKGCVEDLKALNQRGDESLTEEEFLNAYKAAGFVNEEWNKKFFQAFKPVDGKAPFANMVDAWVQFLVSEDSSKTDVVLEILEAYPDL